MRQEMNPGSHEARKQGCTCPLIENGYGKGIPSGGVNGKATFITRPDCPLHGRIG